MPHKDNHNEKNIFQNLKPPFKKSKEDIWATLSDKLEEQPEKQPTKIVGLVWWKKGLAVAAVLLVGLAAFARFYTTNVNCRAGEQIAHSLPDGSTVLLNAESSLTYSPYWWSLDREVSLEGEAFFEVEKGSKFEVVSALGRTTVLGTSFNIFARGEQYEVFCATGKVSVTSVLSGMESILKPNEYVVLRGKDMEKQSGIEQNLVMSWKENKFNFSSLSLAHVFEELARRYNVKLDFEDSGQKYTGNFDQPNTIEEALELVCLSFNLKFTKVGEKHYQIEPK